MGKRNASKPVAKNQGRWWEEAVEVPRAGLPDATKMAKKAKRLRRFVWASVGLFPLTLVVTVIMVASPGPDPVAAVSLDRFAATRPNAVVAVKQWLASSPSPLPGGSLVGWDSATAEKSPLDPQRPEDRYTVEVHHLTVASANGTLFDTVVSLGVSPAIGTVVIGAPSLIPRAPSDSSFSESAWPNLESFATADPVEAAVMAWADAYDSGDPNALRLVIGDTDAARSYVPLVGANLREGDITDAAALWGDTPIANRDGEPPNAIVRATFQIKWNGQTLGEDERDFSTVTYDLLVSRADTAAPAVVAWGGAGTGPSLKPYTSNAVVGRAVEAQTPQEVVSDQAPSAEPSMDPTEQPTDKKTDKSKSKKKSEKKGRHQ